MDGSHQVYLGLGSNLGDRRANIQKALSLLPGAGVQVEAVSRLRETAPVGGPPQGPYLNGALRGRTFLEPLPLLRALKGIESRLGRPPGGPRWGPRSIDLDILLFDDLFLVTSELVLPHPRMGARPFVLEPLVEVLECRWSATGAP